MADATTLRQDVAAFVEYIGRPFSERQAADLRRVEHLLQVKEWLGHASVTTTEQYAHLAPDRNADLAARLGVAPLRVVTERGAQGAS